MRFSIRFIIDSAHTAAFNMAADLFLMEQCSSEAAVITIRFYGWLPAAITIGRMQRALRQLDRAVLEREGVDWIRRPTGGRAVLHADDLTYSCVFSRSLGALGSSVAATYSIITRCLVRGLLYAGIETSVQESASALIKGGRDVRLPCFLAPNRNEIMVQGRKLVGSAQYRSATTVLQHGSIALTEASCELPRFLALSEDDRTRQLALMREKCIVLSEVAPSCATAELVAALARGFTSELGCNGCERSWRDDELSSIAAIVRGERFRAQWLSDAEPDAL